MAAMQRAALAGAAGAAIAMAAAGALLWLNRARLVCWLDASLDAARIARQAERYPLRIILLRHGESAANVDDTLYSTVPDNKIPLTERGCEQARSVGRELRALVGDGTCAFYVSPFLRCQQTCNEVLRAFDADKVSVLEDPRIREQEAGNLQDVTVSRHLQERRLHVGRFFFRYSDGESGADVYDRVTMFLETLFRHFKSPTGARNIVIVAHGMSIRLFLMRYYRWTVSKFERSINLKNAEYCVMELDPATLKYLLTKGCRFHPESPGLSDAPSPCSDRPPSFS